jgi:hypothetical protein
MNDEDVRTHQMTIRSREFMTQSIDDFAAGGAARQLYAELQTGITDFEQDSAEHGAGISDERQGTRLRSNGRDALKADLDFIRAAARVMDIEEQFPKPAQDNDDSLLQTADIYLAHALPLKAQFIAHELPADFLEDLAADKLAFQTAIAGQGNAKGDHISARQESNAKRDYCVARVRKLDGLVKIRYADNPGKLAEWTAASHIERPPKRAKPEPPPTLPPPPQA